MSDDEYTPSTDEIREQVTWQFDGEAEKRAGEAFDRWLAMHDERLRADIASDVRGYWYACGDLIDSNNGARLAFEAVAERIAPESHVAEEADRG